MNSRLRQRTIRGRARGAFRSLLAHPIRRSRLVAAKAAAIAAVVVIVALATWAGMIVGVAVGGGGISLGHLGAFSVQLAFFGFATGAVAIALGAAPAADRSPPASLEAWPSSAG
jgi:ABC-type transport system involved in multi-copper enzyme maturation permease subunit